MQRRRIGQVLDSDAGALRHGVDQGEEYRVLIARFAQQRHAQRGLAVFLGQRLTKNEGLLPISDIPSAHAATGQGTGAIVVVGEEAHIALDARQLFAVAMRRDGNQETVDAGQVADGGQQLHPERH